MSIALKQFEQLLLEHQTRPNDKDGEWSVSKDLMAFLFQNAEEIFCELSASRHVVHEIRSMQIYNQSELPLESVRRVVLEREAILNAYADVVRESNF